MKRLAIAFAMVAHAARELDHRSIFGICRIVRYKTQVNANHVYVELASKIRDRLELGRARGSCFEWHQADGALHGRNIGIAFALETGEHACDLDPEVGQALIEFSGFLRRP